jgi:predicted O-methyltransferase YrrM
MFVLTKEWLRKYYGSSPIQKELTKLWLIKYGKDVPNGVLDEWSNWKHLSEYQVNTLDIVPQCLSKIGEEFKTELQAHLFVNLLRVPLAKSYMEAILTVEPKTILELGVGGDSAISTSVFLNHVEMVGGHLYSVDHNPLGMTMFRYGNYLNSIWTFAQMDSWMYLKGSSGRFDMIFIDTSHSYRPTMDELELASKFTNNILMDDALFEGNEIDDEKGGVKRAIEDWLQIDKDWKKTDLWQGNVVLLKKEI